MEGIKGSGERCLDEGKLRKRKAREQEDEGKKRKREREAVQKVKRNMVGR